MSDTDPADGRARAPGPEAEREPTSETTPPGGDPHGGESGGDDGQYARFERYVNYAVLAGLLLLAFVAVVQFYVAASSAIGTWITAEYRAPFRAVFNLVVLLVAGLGVSLQLRRLRGGTEG